MAAYTVHIQARALPVAGAAAPKLAGSVRDRDVPLSALVRRRVNELPLRVDRHRLWQRHLGHERLPAHGSLGGPGDVLVKRLTVGGHTDLMGLSSGRELPSTSTTAMSS